MKPSFGTDESQRKIELYGSWEVGRLTLDQEKQTGKKNLWKKNWKRIIIKVRINNNITKYRSESMKHLQFWLNNVALLKRVVSALDNYTSWEKLEVKERERGKGGKRGCSIDWKAFKKYHKKGKRKLLSACENAGLGLWCSSAETTSAWPPATRTSRLHISVKPARADG